ncbi:6-bladed beta-propeller [Pedobacter caeni]|uniref:6-bladed beta-propeller protein n=1 Tax=Pedobacter caeni TaxID=288992 RepID=A0A1M5C0P7_9SPHI|nr:6-bladed beta-propeller [Pedobacter caeni]SHF48309.1 hypothetical protein SAMN04488522_1021443 [Pedobacter caeni]
MRNHSSLVRSVRFSLSVLVFFFFLQTKAQNHTLAINVQNFPDSLSRKEIRIDPSSATLETPTAELFDSVVYVPLQTIKQSIFSGIDQMEVTRKCYVILDESLNSIFLFTKDGKFYNKIVNSDKTVESSYKKIGKFVVDEKKEEISFLDPHSFYRFYYSFEGKYLRKTPKVISGEDFYHMSTGLDIYLRSANQMLYRSNKAFFESKPKEATNSILVVDSLKKIRYGYLPLDTSIVALDDLYGVAQTFYNNHSGKITLSIPYNYNIYEIDSIGKMTSTYRFVLPAMNSLPNDFMKNPIYKGNRISYLNNNKNAVYSITDFYQGNKLVTFRLVNSMDLHNFLLYNLQTAELISMIEIMPDHTCFKLPIVQRRIYGVADSNSFISALSASTLFSAKEKLRKDKNWEKQLPQHLKNFYKGDQLQNPVLTLLYLKK